MDRGPAPLILEKYKGPIRKGRPFVIMEGIFSSLFEKGSR